MHSRGDKGGYNLLNLENHVKGWRAAVVSRMLLDSKDIFYIILREKLQILSVRQAAETQYPGPRRHNFEPVQVVPWYAVLLWLGIPARNGGELSDRIALDNSFSKAEKAYFRAWFDLVQRKPKTPGASYDLVGIPLSTRIAPLTMVPAPEASYLGILDIFGAPLSEGTFHNISRKMQNAAEPIQPRVWTFLQIPSSAWSRFWKRISSLSGKLPNSVEALHKFCLGAEAHYPVRECFLCRSTDEQPIASHLYTRCPVSQQCWMQFGLEAHPLVWRTLIANIELPDSVLFKINRFIDFIRTFEYRRKLEVSLVSHVQLGELTPRVLAREIRRHTATFW